MVMFFQMPPIKKNVGILPKQWGRVLPNPTVFLQKKLPQNGLHGGVGGQFPYFLFLLGASFNIEIALAMQSYNFFDIS